MNTVTSRNTVRSLNGNLDGPATSGEGTGGNLERQETLQEHLRRRAVNSGQYYRNEKHPGRWPNNLVGWDGPEDPQSPMNWPVRKKIGCTALLGLTAMGASFASSSFSPTFKAVSLEFDVSTEVTTLTLSLFVLGFAFGPLVCSWHCSRSALY